MAKKKEQPQQPKCPLDCVFRDQPLITKQEVATFIGVDVQALQMMDRYLGVPHAIIGGRWVGTTHTIMAWLTDLIKKNVRLRTYEKTGKGLGKPGNPAFKKWRPDEETLARFIIAARKPPKTQ